MNKSKKTVCMALLLALVLLAVSGCGGSEPSADSAASAEKTESFSWWIPVSVDSSYMEKYQDHPGVQYVLSKPYGANGTKLALDFVVPVTGTQQENFNTLLATGDYTDIMNMSYYTGSVVDLYQDGTILDLTEYVEKYMPNYLAYLDANPDMKLTATTLVDGEAKYLRIYNYLTVPDTWGGYMYRRDWIVRYGRNPADGSAFTGGYAKWNEDGSPDTNSWSDNVVFPSGGASPVYISDWEWMLAIFADAISDQGIADGYPMSLYYPGFSETGDLVCAFGGGGAGWYKDPDNQIDFGPTTDSFRVYLECMNKWFANGWIDKAFMEHSTDMFYAIDDAKVRQGKVGLWYGSEAQEMSKMDTGDAYTSGLVAFAARQPINDLYGSDAEKLKTPYAMYQLGKEATSIAVTDKAAQKDLEALFTFFDYMYSKEGSILFTFGLDAEQVAALPAGNLYEKNGLTDGLYKTIDTADGVKYMVVSMSSDSMLEEALRPTRLFALDSVDLQAQGEDIYYDQFKYQEWLAFENTGWLTSSFTSQLSSEDATAFSKTQTRVREFLAKNVPAFITGAKSPESDADWESFVKAVGKYAPDKNCAIYQKYLDLLLSAR